MTSIKNKVKSPDSSKDAFMVIMKKMKSASQHGDGLDDRAEFYSFKILI